MKAIQAVGEDVIVDAYAKAIAPFRQPNGGYSASAWFRCLLARP